MNISRSIVPILQFLANANHDLPTPAIVVAMCLPDEACTVAGAV